MGKGWVTGSVSVEIYGREVHCCLPSRPITPLDTEERMAIMTWRVAGKRMTYDSLIGSI